MLEISEFDMLVCANREKKNKLGWKHSVFPVLQTKKNRRQQVPGPELLSRVCGVTPQISDQTADKLKMNDVCGNLWRKCVSSLFSL